MIAGGLSLDQNRYNMSRELQRILLTGSPGCGKTTAVTKIVGALHGARVAGFYTEEICEAGRRKGFRWHRLDGRSGTLAHVSIKSGYRVSKYGVDVESFDREAVPAIDPRITTADLFAVDEIGKMECFSEKFVQTVRRLFASEACVLATVSLKGGGLIQEVKSYPTVKLMHLTVANRDEIVRQVAQMLAAAMK